MGRFSFSRVVASINDRQGANAGVIPALLLEFSNPSSGEIDFYIPLTQLTNTTI